MAYSDNWHWVVREDKLVNVFVCISTVSRKKLGYDEILIILIINNMDWKSLEKMGVINHGMVETQRKQQIWLGNQSYITPIWE